MERTKELTWPIHLIDKSDRRWRVIECPSCKGAGLMLRIRLNDPCLVDNCIECEGAKKLGLFTSSVEAEGVEV